MRLNIKYTEDEYDDILDYNNIINKHYKKSDKCFINNKKNDNITEDFFNNYHNLYVHETQKNIGNQIKNIFLNRNKIICQVISNTQSGKTGIISGTILSILNDQTFIIPHNNIFIITGASDNEWLEQTRLRFPPQFKNNIFHRPALLSSLLPILKNKKNILLFIDENHIASKLNNTIFKLFQELNYFDTNKLFDDDIKIVQCSATPNGCLYDLYKWENNDYYDVIICNPGDNYIGSEDLLNKGNIKQYKDIIGDNDPNSELTKKALENITEIFDYLKNYDEPTYIIIRIHSHENKKNNTIRNIKTICKDEFKYFNYTAKDSLFSDINEGLLQRKPKCNTIIFIHNRLSFGKTIYQKYISIMVERYVTKPSDDSILQGFIGRLTGYNNNNNIICFTNIESIIKYKKLFDSNFTNKNINWNSGTTKMINNEITSVNTYNIPNDEMQKQIDSKIKADKCKTIPIIININDDELIKSSTMAYKYEYNRNIIIEIIQKYDEKLAIKLKNLNICEIDCPKTKTSYKTIINPLINAFDKNVKYSSNKLKKYYYKNEDIANIIIDTSLKRLIISIYYGSYQCQ